jgi:hypothetical protein
MSGLILLISVLAYLIVPAWMMSRGRMFTAGLAMIGTSFLPWLVWISVREDLSGPGTGMVMMITALMLLLALVPIAIGAARAVYRFSGRKRANVG